ncbi:MAG: hypothetical protein JNM00_09580, partial [Flavobacteriales bacterium]|nr:hypothetical protein [Flavobacteriales bacterium]
MPATLKFSVLTLMGFVLLGHAGHFQTVNVRSVPVLIDGSPVNCSHTAQSSDGFLWLATSKGLCRHDGVHTIAVSLPSDTTITALEVIGDTLFVGFEDGNYCHFMLKSGQHGPLVKAGSTRVTAFAKLGDMMFISLYGEGLRVDYRLSMQSITTKNGLPDDYAYDVVSLGDKVVVATDMGISLIDRLGKVVQNLDKLDGLSDNLSTTLLRISDSEVLVGYDNGKVDIVHLSSMKISHLTSIENVIKSRITDACLRGDHIWIASSTEGLATFTWPELKLMDHYPATGWGAEIVLSNVMADQEGHVILCGNQSQVLIFDPRILRITQHDGIDFTRATALTVDRGGNLWFASDDGIFFHGEEFITANRLKTLVNTGDSLAQYVCMSEDADGNMWLGTFGKGIARYSPPTGELRWYTEADGLVNNNVLDIKADGRRLWFSTLGGVSLMEDCNRYEFRNFGKADGLGSSYVYCAIADNEGNMLFGTDGAGVMVYDQGSFRPLIEESRVSPRNVVRMAVDGKGRIWILEASGKMKVYDHGKLAEKRLVHNGQELTLFTLTTCADGSIAVL